MGLSVTPHDFRMTSTAVLVYCGTRGCMFPKHCYMCNMRCKCWHRVGTSSCYRVDQGSKHAHLVKYRKRDSVSAISGGHIICEPNLDGLKLAPGGSTSCVAAYPVSAFHVLRELYTPSSLCAHPCSLLSLVDVDKGTVAGREKYQRAVPWDFRVFIKGAFNR